MVADLTDPAGDEANIVFEDIVSRKPEVEAASEDTKASTISRILQALGPGLITGASDDDPSAIGTYAVAGASTGFATLWTALFTFPLMAAVQFICAKIGLVTGKGLTGILRDHYPRSVLYPVVMGLLVVNTISAGVDIGAIAAGVNLVVPISPRLIMVLITLITLAIQIWGSYKIATRIFKWLTLALFAYILAAFFVKPDLSQVLLHTFVPTLRFDTTFLLILVALLGTTISPYLFFWQSDLEAEENKIIQRETPLWTHRNIADTALRYAFWDTTIGMFFSNLVMYFIILTTGATLFTTGQTHIQTAEAAAAALRPLAGDGASLLFAFGLAGSGSLAVPVLIASGAYAVSQAFGWEYGLDQKPGHARQFYGVID